MEIVHSEMVSALVKDGEAIRSSLSAEDCHILHMAVGISGEVAELQEAVVKAKSDSSLSYIKFDRVNLVEELGDIEFYIEGLCQGLGIENPSSDTVTAEDAATAPPFVTLIYSLKVGADAGAILDYVKKAVVYRKQLELDELTKSIADLCNSLDIFRAIVNVSRDEALADNIEKLGKRYEGFKYSNQAAIDRADKA